MAKKKASKNRNKKAANPAEPDESAIRQLEALRRETVDLTRSIDRTIVAAWLVGLGSWFKAARAPASRKLTASQHGFLS